MIYEIIQTHATQDAHFMIKDHDNHLLGSIDYHKNVFKLTLGDQDYEIHKGLSSHLLDHDQPKNDPYIIYEGHRDSGGIYETTALEDQLTYHQTYFNGHLYSLYAIHFSSRDMALNIFEGRTQLGQLELERQLTKDEMYTFHLYVKDDDDIFKAAVFSLMYYYMKEILSTHHAHNYQSDAAREFAYSKYDPSFIATLNTK